MFQKFNKNGFTPHHFSSIKISSTKSGAGFTLLEVVVAIFVITIGAVGVISMVQKITSFAQVSSSRFQAAYLIQEGMEIVRNIRDTNWLEGSPWNEGLPAGDWEADYKTQNLTQAYAERYLNIDSNGFYSYSTGKATKFKRKITILPEGSDILKIAIQVSWKERGEIYSLEAKGNLYKWR